MTGAKRRTSRQEIDLMRPVLVGYVTGQSFLLLVFFVISPYLIGGLRVAEAWSIIQILLPLFTGYLGQIVGFYFGMQKERE